MSSEGEVEGREICEVVAGSHADLCLLQCSLHHVIWATSSVCSIGVFFGTGAPLDSGRFKLALREALCYYQDGRGQLDVAWVLLQASHADLVCISSHQFECCSPHLSLLESRSFS